MFGRRPLQRAWRKQALDDSSLRHTQRSRSASRARTQAAHGAGRLADRRRPPPRAPCCGAAQASCEPSPQQALSTLGVAGPWGSLLTAADSEPAPSATGVKRGAPDGGRTVRHLGERGRPERGLDRRECGVEQRADPQRFLPDREQHERHEMRREQHVRQHRHACAAAPRRGRRLEQHWDNHSHVPAKSGCLLHQIEYLALSSFKRSVCYGVGLPGRAVLFRLASPGSHHANAQRRAALRQAGAGGGTVGGAQVVGGPEGADHDDAERVERVVDHRDVHLRRARVQADAYMQDPETAAGCCRAAGDGAGAPGVPRTPEHAWLDKGTRTHPQA